MTITGGRAMTFAFWERIFARLLVIEIMVPF